jgi:transposase-like protein
MSEQTKPTFDTMFKECAVREIRRGTPIAKFSQANKVGVATLRRWMKEHPDPEEKHLVDQTETVRQLRQENLALREENLLLIRAAACFARQIT